MRMMTRFVSTVLLLPFALTVVLIGGPAAAQDLKGDKELTERGQKIDKAAGSADSGRVTDRIVNEWKGTTFTFNSTDSHQLAAGDVQGLRQKGLGFGEISILLALAAKQTSTDPKSVNDILAKRKDGEGWGKIAKDLGYKDLGSVLKSVKSTEKGVDQAAHESRERAAKLEKSEKLERVEKPEKIERVERPERPERPGR